MTTHALHSVREWMALIVLVHSIRSILHVHACECEQYPHHVYHSTVVVVHCTREHHDHVLFMYSVLALVYLRAVLVLEEKDMECGHWTLIFKLSYCARDEQTCACISRRPVIDVSRCT